MKQVTIKDGADEIDISVSSGFQYMGGLIRIATYTKQNAIPIVTR